MRLDLSPWPAAAALLTTFLTSACGEPRLQLEQGDGPTFRGDASVPTREPLRLAVMPPASPVPPAAPATPDPPVLTPCPDGWAEAAGGLHCEPWAIDDSPDRCAGTEAWFGDDARICRELGSGCPAGEFPANLPEGRPILYVRGGESGGDGTPDAPYGTIAKAITEAPEGALIALARGTYEEAVSLGPGLTLWGACVSETILRSSEPATEAGVVTAAGLGAVVRNLQIQTSARPGLVAPEGTSLEAADIAIDETTVAGAWAFGGELVLRNAVVSRTRTRESVDGYGAHASKGGAIRIDRAWFQQNHSVGVYADGAGSTLTVQDAAVRRTQSGDDGGAGWGLAVDSGAVAEVARLVVEHNRDNAVVVADEGTSASFVDLLVRDTRPRESDGFAGVGLVVGAGAEVDAERIVSLRNHTLGLAAIQNGTLRITDALVLDIEPTAANGRAGIGVVAQSGGQLEARRLRVERVRSRGILLEGNASGTLEDVMVADVVPEQSTGLGEPGGPPGGNGISAQLGAVASLGRVLIENARETALRSGAAGAVIEAEDVTVRSTRGGVAVEGAPPGGTLGWGLVAEQDGVLRVARALVEDSEGFGVFVDEPGAELRLEDGVIRGTRSGPDGSLGRGLTVQRAAIAVLERVLIEDNREAGVVVIDSPEAESRATLRARDVLVRGTESRSLDGRFGRGLIVQEANAELVRAQLENNREVGAWIGRGGSEATLQDVVVRETRSSDLGVGRGVAVQEGATARLERVRITDSEELGLAVTGSTLDARLVDVGSTAPRGCPEPSCSGGTGVGVYEGAQVTMRDFLVRQAALCGVQLARGGAVRLETGDVVDNRIGACIQNDDVSLDGFLEDVRFAGNQRNLDATRLPSPSPLSGLVL
jgi:hypothetical protein